MPRPERRIADAHRLARRLKRIAIFNYQTHSIPLKIFAIRYTLPLRLLVYSDLLWEPLFRLPTLSVSRGLSQIELQDDIFTYF